MLTDEATIKIKAGDGGSGRVSFRREKYVPRGGPDGGDGGDGGNVYFICDDNVHTLSDFARKKDFSATRGEDGGNKKKHGKDGADLFLKVPPGTLMKQNDEIFHDFIEIGDEVLGAKGGRGGWGNVHFATATNQTPLYARPGTSGEGKTLTLELKIIADIGLIGLPNAGKSTLLSRISGAKPKIAAYPFTTLEPNLGALKIYDQELIVADIPGLIEGASAGKGLGDKFLRHVERTRKLVHLIDISSENLAKDYKVVRDELKKWNEELLKKDEIVVLTKADILDPKKARKQAETLKEKIKKEVLVISASSGLGIKEFLNKLI